jgi:hypothetical protein
VSRFSSQAAVALLEKAGIMGYHDCDCCGETIIDRRFCDACFAAGCPATTDDRIRDDCQIPQCFDCCEGEGPRASLMNDGHWHSNCDAPCPNAGVSWRVHPTTTTKAVATAADLNTAAARCKARGVSTLFPTVWEEAMAAELESMGLTTLSQADVDAAADARLARGEANLHAARVAAANGKVPS